MIRTSPFHERTSALNETGLWSHWSGHLAANRYQMSDKFEYFAVRNSAGVFDSSPLYKYRIHGPDAERFLAGVLARDIRACPPGHAQYTAWCDDRGFVVEDGVILRHGRGRVPADRRRAEPRLLRGPRRPRPTSRSRRSATTTASSPSRGRARATCWRAWSRASRRIPFFGLDRRADRRPAGDRLAHRLQRRPRLRDLGPSAGRAPGLGRAVGRRSTGYGVLPFGLAALYMLRIEAGLLLLDVDFASSRFAWTDEDRSTPIELGWAGCSATSPTDDRAFIGRRAIERELADETSRWRLTGLVVDWRRLRPDLRRAPG